MGHLTSLSESRLVVVMVVVNAFNPSAWEAEAGESLNSRPARAPQRNPVSF